MGYFYLRRGQILLCTFVVSSLLLYGFPGIDIQISRIFFELGFYSETRWWETLLHENLGHIIYASLVSVVGLYAYNRLAKRDLCRVSGRKVLFLFLVLIIGAGLIVNVMLKEQFGRARPRDIEEFGGAMQFTPAFVISQQCDTNCSFSSGEAAGAFFSMALALVLSRRRAVLVAACIFGVLASGFRVSAGAHFFSDVVVSFFVMSIVTDMLYYHVVAPRPRPAPSSVRLIPVRAAADIDF